MALNELLGDKVLKSAEGGEEVDVSSFAGAGKVLAIYFSAHWCPPCRAFTPQLATWYKNVKKGPNGDNFNIVFVSSDSSEKDFTSYFKEMPWHAVPYSDRAKKDTLSKKFKVSGIPTLIILDAETSQIISSDGRSIVLEDEKGKEFPWKPKPFPELIKGKFLGKDGEELPETAIDGKILGVYFSAHWCGPCRAFTPQLVNTYNTLKKQDKNFEIIFVSSDNTDESFKSYFASMPWIAVPWSDPRVKPLKRLFEVRGIPTLVIMDEQGRIITSNGRAAVGDDAEGAEFPWYPKPVNRLTSATAGEVNDKPSLIWFSTEDSASVDSAHKALKPIAERKIAEWKASNKEPQMIFYVAGKEEADDDIISSLRAFAQLGTKVPHLAIVDIPNQEVFECDAEKVDGDAVEAFLKGYADKTVTGKPLRA